ncbi:hypothetical protein [Streptomyces sp. NPDC058279]|uniref:hypothetical protein n=1 Tax=Streptomyces sp. NPDC058279 TaxID=3346418 RepID=UPI0036E4E9E7
MRVLLAAHGSHGDIEPILGLGSEPRALGAEVQTCAPPEFAELRDGVGVPLVPLSRSLHAMATSAVTGRGKPLPAESLSERAARAVAETCESVTAVTEGCDVAVVTGVTPGTRARAAAVAATIRIDGATAAVKPLLDTVGCERPPVTAPHPARAERI